MYLDTTHALGAPAKSVRCNNGQYDIPNGIVKPCLGKGGEYTNPYQGCIAVRSAPCKRDEVSYVQSYIKQPAHCPPAANYGCRKLITSQPSGSIPMYNVNGQIFSPNVPNNLSQPYQAGYAGQFWSNGHLVTR